MASDEAAKVLYGEKHPWGQPGGGTPETVQSISVADLRDFHRTWYRPNNALISVAGDVTADEIVRLLDQRLAGWKKGNLPKLQLPPLPPLTRRYIAALDSNITSIIAEYELTRKYTLQVRQSYDFGQNRGVFSSASLIRHFDRFFTVVTIFKDTTEDNGGISIAILPEGLSSRNANTQSLQNVLGP